MKVQVNLSDEMVSRVDKHAKNIGMSRSSLCAYLIGQGIVNMDTAYSLVENMGSTLIEQIDKNELKKELGIND